MSNFHWLDLSEYLAISIAVVGAIAAAASSTWIYAVVPMLISLILNAINRWRSYQNIRLHERTLERKLDRELQQQGEVLQQEIAQARSFATALVKQTMAANKSEPAALTAANQQEVIALEQKFDRHKQLMQSMQDHVTGVEGSLKDVVDLLEGNALTERVEYLERHLMQVSQQLGIEPARSQPVKSVPTPTVADEPEVDITPLLDMISEDLMSGDLLLPENLVSGELSGDLWSKPTWYLRQTIDAHADWVRCLSFTPDGTQLVSGSFDKSIKLWQVDTGQLVRTFTDSLKGVFALAVSPDGKLLASGSWDEAIALWDLVSGAWIRNLTQHQSSVRALAIAPDNQTLVSGSFDRSIVLWQLPTGTVQTIIGDLEPIAAISLSADGTFFVSTGDDGTIDLWSLATGTALLKSKANQHCIGSLTIAPDGRTIAAGTVNGYILLWQLDRIDDRVLPSQIELVQTIKAHAGQINACVFSPDGQYLITGSVDGKAKVWHRGEDRQFRDKARSILKGDPGRSVMSVAISQHDRSIAIGGADGTIQLWQRT